ncbi:ribonuclease T [Thioclava sp. SK-1]|uniref:ribonuclease T2 family protein n=1 Tax=Thioclava sp. SK-1 TaxID=1889770 RepID=UPI00082525ED|nr:ribonuclease T2 [Thioclava sp. SK-1]OCX61203.1 ribonuclease T [Thioclava sp. SK-1]
MACCVVFLNLTSVPIAQADGEAAGDFDYYVLALSWSPTWCALEGDARQSPQCAQKEEFSFVLHGLWPQYEDGWPQYCRTTARDPQKRTTAAMTDIMGAPGAAWYQWKKHGRCTGLAASDYFRLARLAYDSVEIPEVFQSLKRDVKLPASVVEDAFLEVNPNYTRDSVTVTCRDRRIQEVRICLNRALMPRDCGPDVIRDCTLSDARMDGIR